MKPLTKSDIDGLRRMRRPRLVVASDVEAADVAKFLDAIAPFNLGPQWGNVSVVISEYLAAGSCIALDDDRSLYADFLTR